MAETLFVLDRKAAARARSMRIVPSLMSLKVRRATVWTEDAKNVTRLTTKAAHRQQPVCDAGSRTCRACEDGAANAPRRGALTGAVEPVHYLTRIARTPCRSAGTICRAWQTQNAVTPNVPGCEIRILPTMTDVMARPYLSGRS